MSNAESAQNTGPTTQNTGPTTQNTGPSSGQAAAGDDDFTVGTTGEEFIPEADIDDGFTGDADLATTSSSADLAPGAQLLDKGERETIVTRWREIQAGFVDEPRAAVQDADALVTELMERLSRAFASELDQLESRWASGEQVSTEDLRQGLRRYRSFFERLLAA